MGVELLKSSGGGSDSILKALWHHSDAIMCCSVKVILSSLALLVFLLFHRVPLLLAGSAGFHICKPGWGRHARDNPGCTSRHHSREDL